MANAMSGFSRMQNADDAGFADRFGGGRKTAAGQRNRDREAVALRRGVDHRLTPRRGVAIELYPAIDHDKERRRGIALSKQDFMRPQQDDWGLAQ